MEKILVNQFESLQLPDGLFFIIESGEPVVRYTNNFHVLNIKVLFPVISCKIKSINDALQQIKKEG